MFSYTPFNNWGMKTNDFTWEVKDNTESNFIFFKDDIPFGNSFPFHGRGILKNLNGNPVNLNISFAITCVDES